MASKMVPGKNKIALLVIDMQVGLFAGEPPRHDAEGTVQRINAVGKAVRGAGGIVIFIQHEDEILKVGSEAWQLLPALERSKADLAMRKKACDSFYRTELSHLLERRGIKQLIITGCATDFCVDTTVRAAASREYEEVVVKDGHTTKDRPHLDAATIIKHHNWMWANLILPEGEVKVMPAEDVVQWICKANTVTAADTERTGEQ
jgi:nicotinamidase-related amidase